MLEGEEIVVSTAVMVRWRFTVAEKLPGLARPAPARSSPRARVFLDTVLLKGGDNLCESTALEKGRSQDPALLKVLRRALAYPLGSEIRWLRRHAESEENSPDADSRRFSPAGVSVRGPALQHRSGKVQHALPRRLHWWPEVSRQETLPRRG